MYFLSTHAEKKLLQSRASLIDIFVFILHYLLECLKDIHLKTLNYFFLCHSSETLHYLVSVKVQITIITLYK